MKSAKPPSGAWIVSQRAGPVSATRNEWASPGGAATNPPAGFADFDASYLIVAQYPGPQGERPSDLAARLRISKQALNHLLGQLEHRGYLKRQPDPDDKRSKRIALTPRGTQAGIVIRQAVTEMEDAWKQQLGPKRFAQLRALLQELNRPA
ncbi:MAG TPA: MarR family transcriptional regulator [Gaiellaceae bacterium]|jgi:DNA-binding MarR family transcriptional regulator|nr:MarR family transcriptional regulator [Gaiellaceae bacterium]